MFDVEAFDKMGEELDEALGLRSRNIRNHSDLRDPYAGKKTFPQVRIRLLGHIESETAAIGTTDTDTAMRPAVDDAYVATTSSCAGIRSEELLKIPPSESHAYAAHIRKFMFNMVPKCSDSLALTCHLVVEAMNISQDHVIRSFIKVVRSLIKVKKK